MDFIRTFYSTTLYYYWEEKSKGHFVSKMMNVNEWNGPLPCTISPFFPPASYLFLAEALPDAVPTFEAKLSKVKAKIAFRLFSGMFAISSLKRKTVGQLFKIYHCSLGLWLSPHFTLLYITLRTDGWMDTFIHAFANIL